MYRRRGLMLAGSLILLCAALCGCSALIETEEPPATWMPLPTRTPADTSPPSITPTLTVTSTSTATPEPPTATVEATQTDAIITETPQPTATPTTATPTTTPERVEGWRGRLHSLPEAATFDDYFRRLGGEGGQYGIEAADAALEKELAQWRDSERIIRIWGVLQRDVEDYGDVRIRAERLEVEAAPPTPVPDSELVEGWIGTVHSLPPEAAYDDYFYAQSPSGQYGIASPIDRLAQELEAYRDTGTVIRIWGVLDYGVSDYGDRRILVTRIEEMEP